jgi:hypothetical protein
MAQVVEYLASKHMARKEKKNHMYYDKPYRYLYDPTPFLTSPSETGRRKQSNVTKNKLFNCGELNLGL